MRASVPMWRCRYSNRRSDGSAHALPNSTRAATLACASLTLMLALCGSRTAAAQEAYVERIPGTLVAFEMVAVPAGVVTVGAGNASETIEVAPFWIAKTETTWDLYDVYVYELDGSAPLDAGLDAVSRPSKPYVLPGDEFGHDGMPALGMSLKAAREFARWLSVRTGHSYRVPTEAQWRHACGLGSDRVDTPAVAWTSENSDNQTHAVGSKSTDALGLHDMRGNVAEWVESIDADSVVMGGAWDRPAAESTCSSRIPQRPAWQMTDPQLPKSSWWLTDAPFVGVRLIRLPDDPTDEGGTP